jgi:hypothetical protein
MPTARRSSCFSVEGRCAYSQDLTKLGDWQNAKPGLEIKHDWC